MSITGFKMEAVSSSKTFVTTNKKTYIITWRATVQTIIVVETSSLKCF
jgi:hypothetical protein